MTERPALAQPFYSKRVKVASSLVNTDLRGLGRIEGRARRTHESISEQLTRAEESDAHSGETGFEGGAP